MFRPVAHEGLKNSHQLAAINISCLRHEGSKLLPMLHRLNDERLNFIAEWFGHRRRPVVSVRVHLVEARLNFLVAAGEASEQL